MAGKIILCKVTSRERPDILLSTIKQYIDLAANAKDMRWLFSFDEDDPSINEVYKRLTDLIEPTEVGHESLAVVAKSESKIHAINRDVDQYVKQFPNVNWDILLNISDDQTPQVKGYDDVIRKAMPDDLDASVWFNDGWQDRINTQEIVGRKYFDRFGYIYHPSYKSFFCDNEATAVARKLGKLLQSKQSLIRHDHPQWNPNSHIKEDNLYRKNNAKAFWDHDMNNYNERKKRKFDL
jgi:hypothetical protein